MVSTQTSRSGGVDLDAATLHIGGDVVGRDKIITGGDFVQGSKLEVAVAEGGNAQINNYLGQPQITRLPPDAKPLAQPIDFTARTAETNQLEQLLRQRQPLVIYGPEGVGKTALLRKLTASEAARSLPDGIVLVESVNLLDKASTADDLIQRWFDQLYASTPHCLVNADQARTYLKQTQALVVLDHLSVSSLESLNALVELSAAGALAIAWPALPVTNQIKPFKLRPLARADAQALLAAILNLSVDAQNSALLDRICEQLADMPLALVTVAKIVTDQDLTLDQAEATLASSVVSTSERLAAGVERAFGLAYSILTAVERQLLHIVAAAPGLSHAPDRLADILTGTLSLDDAVQRAKAIDDQLVIGGVKLRVRRHGADRAPSELVPNEIVDVDSAHAALDRLKGLGLLHANSPRLRIDPGFRALAQRDADADRILAHVAAHLLVDAAAGKFRDRAYCQAEWGNVLGAISWAAEHQQWTTVVELGRAIDPYLMLSGLWDAWGGVLDQVGQAAHQIGDRALSAWVLHQSGTRAAGLARTSDAIGLLRQALELRRSIGDAGAAITQHNLNLLAPPLPPPARSGGSQQPPMPRPARPAARPAAPRPSSRRSPFRLILALGLIALLGWGAYQYGWPALRPLLTSPSVIENTPTPAAVDTPTPFLPPNTPAPTVLLVAPQLIAPINDQVINCDASQAVPLSWADFNKLGDVTYEWEFFDKKFGGGKTASPSATAALACGLNYQWHARVVDSAGNPGPWSDYASFIVAAPPAAPQGGITPAPNAPPAAPQGGITPAQSAPPAAPQDTTGPTISVYPAKPDVVACKGSVQLGADVVDPSGVASVYLWYQIDGSNGTTGPLQDKLTRVNGAYYQINLNPYDNPAVWKILGTQDGILRWYVQAVDSLGNSAASAEQKIPIQVCK